MNYRSKILNDIRIKAQRDPEVKGYLQITLMVLLLAIFIGFAIRPSIATAIMLKREIRDYQDISNAIDQKILDLREIRSNYSQLSKEIRLLDQTIPNGPEEGNLLKMMSYIASKNQVTITSTNFRYNPGSPLSTLNFSLQIKGPYQNMLSFLSDIQNLMRVVVVDSISLVPDRDDPKSVFANFEAKAFYLEENK